MPSYLLITGAAGGLAGALAQEFARRGYPLYLSDRRPEVAEVAQRLAVDFNIETHWQVCELSSAEERTAWFEKLAAEDTRFCGLANVAGLEFEGEFLSKSRQQIGQIIQVNIAATVDLTHAILHRRDSEKRFLLITVSSLAAYAPMPYKAVYSASKRFLLNWSLALREEIRDFGDVLALCPAGLPTTPEIIRKNHAQGFWGRATVMPLDTVARETVRRALRGDAVYIPGALNRLLAWIELTLPTRIVTRYLAHRWQKVWEKLGHS